MTAWYKTQGMTLAQAMDTMYRKHGFFRNDLACFTFEGADGMKKMASIMNALRVQPPKMLHRESVIAVADYLKGINDLPRSNVLEFQTKYAKVLIRPSGTEPKVKVYLSSRAATMEQAAANNQAILEEITNTYLK